MSEVNVMQEQWDYLIILDACRYDYFEQTWQKYLKGHLEKRISVGSSTKEWRNRSFTDYYGDVIYISANPYINSKAAVKGFLARDYFFKVYDLWLADWDDDKGTVLPQSVTKRAIEITIANADKRAIIHYQQPHEPYLNLGNGTTDSGPESPIRCGIPVVEEANPKHPIASRVMAVLSGILYWLGIRSNGLLWRLLELLKAPPASPMDAVRRAYGQEGLRKAYRRNLEIALEHVAKLVEALSGRIVVTADHGEMLGENNCYSHWSRSSEKSLLEVPWLVIDQGKRTVEAAAQPKSQRQPLRKRAGQEKDDDEAKREIQEKLRALGYFD